MESISSTLSKRVTTRSLQRTMSQSEHCGFKPCIGQQGKLINLPHPCYIRNKIKSVIHNYHECKGVSRGEGKGVEERAGGDVRDRNKRIRLVRVCKAGVEHIQSTHTCIIS